MKSTLITIGTLVVAITLVFILPKFILGWIGCYQLGSWASDITNKYREN